MFNELFPIVNEAGTLIIRLQIDKQDPTKLQAFVTPQHPNGEKYPALNQTVMLSNTPSGLDEEFATVYRAYVPEYVAASAAIKDSVAQLVASTEAAKKAVTKISAKADTSKSTPSTAKPAAKPAPAAEPQVSLFTDLDHLETQNNAPPGDQETDEEEEEATVADTAAFVAPDLGEAIQPSVFTTSAPSIFDIPNPPASSTSAPAQQAVLLEPSLAAPPPAPANTAPPAALFETI